jgi:restriction system protein
MPVPDYETLKLPLLRALEDSVAHPVGALRNSTASEWKLTDQNRANLLPSGKQAVVDNRVGWAKIYLDKAGLVASVRRGVNRLAYIDLPA